MTERKAVTKEMAGRYRRATRLEKSTMLDQLVALTGWSRRHARRAIAAALEPPASGKPRGRPPTYASEVIKTLRQVWAVLDGPCGKRLAPFMEEIVQAMERAGEIRLTPANRAKLVAISAATIDRILAQDRRRLQLKGRHGTKPGSLLRQQIPIRTFAEWDDARPGFCEMDLCGHDGGDLRGQFAQTLTLTDIVTGWTDVRILKNKAHRWVFEAFEEIRADLPFPLLGIDSDNGSEFINTSFFEYCTREGITFTRSRPWRKNDNCHVEQKNWSVVRQALGYARYDTDEELVVIGRLYQLLRPYVNFFQPQMRLVEKTRNGAKVRRRYDTPKTPYQRILASPDITQEAKQVATNRYLELNPVTLRRDLTDLQTELVRITGLKTQLRRREVKTHPDHPWRTWIVRQ